MPLCSTDVWRSKVTWNTNGKLIKAKNAAHYVNSASCYIEKKISFWSTTSSKIYVTGQHKILREGITVMFALSLYRWYHASFSLIIDLLQKLQWISAVNVYYCLKYMSKRIRHKVLNFENSQFSVTPDIIQSILKFHSYLCARKFHLQLKNNIVMYTYLEKSSFVEESKLCSSN